MAPFLFEDEMLKLGAIFSKKANWADHVVSDGLLITGQNRRSSDRVGQGVKAGYPSAGETRET